MRLTLHKTLHYQTAAQWRATDGRLSWAHKEFGTPFTILRPNYFFQNALGLKGALTLAGFTRCRSAAPGLSVVGVRDIAEAAGIVLTTEGHEGKTYNVVGPEVLSGAKVASIWSAALGKPIRYPGEHMDAFEEQMRTQAPSWVAFDIRMMLQGFLERGFAATADDAAASTKLLGPEPRSYADFAREAALGWKNK